MRAFAAIGGLVLAAGLLLAPASAAQPSGLQKINQLVAIYQENWSFDSLYGSFPGANGLDQAGPTTPQVDRDGTPFSSLPQPLNTLFTPAVPTRASRLICRWRRSIRRPTSARIS